MGEIASRLPETQNDINYVLSGWIKGARKAERHTMMHNKDYFVYFRHKVIKTLANSFTKLFYDTDAPEVLIGFMVYTFTIDDDLVIHWVCVPKSLRQQGHATQFIKSVIPDWETSDKKIIATMLPADLHLKDLTKRYADRVSYNPYFSLLVEG